MRISVKLCKIKFGPVVHEIAFKDTSILTLVGIFFLWSGRVCASLVKAIMRNTSVKLY